ncbi:MAG: hypothetical protein P8101_17350 [Candidatus Thiodiazotropha sp.]|jgi:hypothetical protein
MLKKNIPIAALLFAGLGSVGNLSLANTTDIMATTVPASICQPLTSSDASKVRLSNGQWTFTGSAVGKVNFYCPYLRNAWHMSSDGNYNSMTSYRILYRDSDGTGNAAQVTTRFFRRGENGIVPAGSTWDSNNYTDSGNNSRIHNNSHSLSYNGNYYFFVTIYRSNSTQNPAFSGIDFWMPTPG